MSNYSTYFKGRNFMTPDYIGFYETGDYVIELSSGSGFSSNMLYGVTVKNKIGHDNVESLSACFPEIHQAREVITLIESGDPDKLEQAQQLVAATK